MKTEMRIAVKEILQNEGQKNMQKKKTEEKECWENGW
jgi:hypothetical protein